MRHEQTIRREMRRIARLRGDRRKHVTDENYHLLLGAEWALQYVLAGNGSKTFPGVSILLRRRLLDE